jgi:hypothetical protein
VPHCAQLPSPMLVVITHWNTMHQLHLSHPYPFHSQAHISAVLYTKHSKVSSLPTQTKNGNSKKKFRTKIWRKRNYSVAYIPSHTHPVLSTPFPNEPACTYTCESKIFDFGSQFPRRGGDMPVSPAWPDQSVFNSNFNSESSFKIPFPFSIAVQNADYTCCVL